MIASSACRKIQQFWRRSGHRKTATITQMTIKHGLTTDYLKTLSFDDLVLFLRNNTTISCAKVCVDRFRRGYWSQAINVRVFLAAYMIVLHPGNVFESVGALEAAVIESARRLVEIYENILRSSLHTKSFSMALLDYYRDFKAWKVPDEAKLMARIKHGLLALYQARQQLPTDEPVDSQLNAEFRKQIRRLRDKVLQIKGPDELAAFDRENVAVVRMETIQNVVAQGRAYTALTDRMTNEQLAHELLMDPNFQLTDRGTCCESDAAQRVRESFHKAFWDSLATDLSMGFNVRVLRVLAEVRDGIKEVTKLDAMDLDIIKQQADAGLFTWASCHELVGSVVALIQRAQSPRRDAETAEKWAELQTADQNPASLCRDLEFLLDRVNALRIDAANDRLRMITPVIRVNGVEYERIKFQEKLDCGALTLERTKDWLGRPDGVSSNNDIFVRALVGLVAEPTEVFPETLLMDERRIRKLNEEFAHVARSAALVARMALDNAKLARIASALASDRDMRQAVETVTDVTRPIAIAIEQCADSNDVVCNLMRTRLCDAIKSGAIIGFHPSAVLLVQQLAVKVNLLIAINRRVHGPTYDRLLGEV